MMNINTIISQRLKLAQENLEFADWETTLDYIIAQGRDLTPDQVQAEKCCIRFLYAQARDNVKTVEAGGQDYFLQKICALSLTNAEMAAWVAQAADPILSLNDSQTVAPQGFLPSSVKHALQQLQEEQLAGTPTTISSDRLEELMAYCLLTHAMLSLTKPQSREKQQAQDRSSAVTAEDTLAMKAVESLGEAGKLPKRWKYMTMPEIHDLFSCVRQDATVHMTNDQLIRMLTNQMVADYAQYRSTQALPVAEITEEDQEARHLLAISALLNMKATGLLPEEMGRMTDLDLATMAYAGTELNFYFNEAAAGRISMDTFLEIAGKLLVCAFLILLTVVCFTAPSGAEEKVVGVILGLAAIVYLTEAVEIFLENMFPAGVSETRLGIWVKANVHQIALFAGRVKEKILSAMGKDRDNDPEPPKEPEHPDHPAKNREDDDEDEETEDREKETED